MRPIGLSERRLRRRAARIGLQPHSTAPDVVRCAFCAEVEGPMKEKIHPQYEEILVRCVTCGTEFTTRSTRLELAKHDHQGRSLPTMSLEICSNCHPFYTGKQTIVDTAGRVEKYLRRYGKAQEKAAEPAAETAAAPTQAASKPQA